MNNMTRFNTVNGKYCCDADKLTFGKIKAIQFQYRKR